MLTDSLIDKVHLLLFYLCLSCVPLSTNADRFTSIALLAQEKWSLYRDDNVMILHNIVKISKNLWIG